MSRLHQPSRRELLRQHNDPSRRRRVVVTTYHRGDYDKPRGDLAGD